MAGSETGISPTDTFLFGLRPNQISRRIKQAAQAAGLGDGLQRTLTADWDGVRLGEGGNGVAQPDDGRTLEFAADAGALHSQ